MKSVNITLQGMTRGSGLSTIAAAYVFAALLVAGPWIFTVLGIVGLGAALCDDACEKSARPKRHLPHPIRARQAG